MRLVFVLFVLFSLFLQLYCSKNNNSNAVCLRDLKKVANDVVNSKKWALQMIDASGKVPSGILEGNLIELGNFQQCINIKHDDVTGKYCLVKIPISDERQTKNNFKSHMEALVFQRKIDPNLILGICIPESCTIKDIISVTNLLLNSTLSEMKSMKKILPYAKMILESVSGINTLPFIQNSTYLEAVLNDAKLHQRRLEKILSSDEYQKLFNIAEGFCQNSQNTPENSAVNNVGILLIGLFCFIVLISTYCELLLKYFYQDTSTFNSIIMSFSLRRNICYLFKNDKESNKIHCIDGLRVFSISWVIFGHVVFAYFTVPNKNPTDMIKWIDTWHSKIITSCDLAVDTFLVISGFLIAYLTMKSLESGIRLNITFHYLYRYLRITPAVIMIMLISSVVVDNFCIGPLCPLVVQQVKAPCLKYWWGNILFIHNYFNFDNKCLGPTWYLSLDMQLYILSPFLILAWRKWSKLSYYMNIIILATSVFIPIYYTWIYKLSINMLLMKNYDYLEYYYHSTECRYGPWFIGLLSGYYCYNNQTQMIDVKKVYDKDVKYKPWFVCFMIIILIIFGQQYFFINEYNILESSIFNGFHRHFWALLMCWIIQNCIKGNGGIINDFLSNYCFKILSRLSYSIFLIHFIVITTLVGQTNTSYYFSDYNIFKEFVGVFIVTIIFAALFYLTIELPLNNVVNIFFKNKKKRKKSDQNMKHIVINNLSNPSRKHSNVNIYDE